MPESVLLLNDTSSSYSKSEWEEVNRKCIIIIIIRKDKFILP